LAAGLSLPHRHTAISRYFVQNHADEPMAQEHCRRIVACVDYFLAHRAEFAVEHHADNKQDSFWISPYLHTALYRIFASAEMVQLDRDFPVAWVIGKAEEQQRLYPVGDAE
jgi:hypothetical protein